ncbi:AraC family transcriptional regulator [bacterium BMS3Abin03]|jgi:AraC-like DNA-binding protein|nr:AraC family transcriptional regulator [bacterium BMS3Abin03]MCG6959008.1 AraC family transcriptional regulator [bacterium BMS3Abin03]
MDSKTLHIKNMVCNRCIKVVREEIEKLDYNVDKIELGEVQISTSEKNFDMEKIQSVLEKNGFELLSSRNANIIERVKILIINLIHHNEEDNLSEVNLHKEIIKNSGLSYQYLSSLFSSIEGITIEKFIIQQKIEKAKELIVYDELTISEIAYRLGYSSVQHLSNQFKKVTGLSPSYFKGLKSHKRNPIDKIQQS